MKDLFREMKAAGYGRSDASSQTQAIKKSKFYRSLDSEKKSAFLVMNRPYFNFLQREELYQGQMEWESRGEMKEEAEDEPEIEFVESEEVFN
jgi:hypothetical protein